MLGLTRWSRRLSRVRRRSFGSKQWFARASASSAEWFGRTTAKVQSVLAQPVRFPMCVCKLDGCTRAAGVLVAFPRRVWTLCAALACLLHGSSVV
eukprot:6197971-Pleurochrysis_carterae.AAC.2